MIGEYRVALNPLPWVLGPDGFHLEKEVLDAAFRDVARTGFKSVQADIPHDMSVPEYRALLDSHGLSPAPGYFSGYFHDTSQLTSLVESARRHAAAQAEVGNTEVFLAAGMEQARLERPATGHGADDERLTRIVEGVAAVSAVITAEGVTPCLHQHVGSSIETEAELRRVLDSVPGSDLAFGPDTGHMFWAGMDVVAVIRDYSARVAGIHLKDVVRDRVHSANSAGHDFATSTYSDHVWTELGRGDVDMEGVLRAVPASFVGWYVVEVDVPDTDSKIASTLISADWVREHLGAGHLVGAG